MNKFIQIKNAEKIFFKHNFKLSGHRVIFFLDNIAHKLTTIEYDRLKKYLINSRDEHGDFEFYIKVHPGKIEIINFQKEDDMGGVF